LGACPSNGPDAIAVVAVLLCVLPFLLVVWARQDISSGLASILDAATP